MVEKKILSYSDVAIAVILGICSLVSEELFRLIITVIAALALLALRRFVEDMV